MVVELLERFPPEATGVTGSAHMQAAAAYLRNSEELAGCRRTVGRAIPAFDPDAATSPAGVFCMVRCRHPLPEVVEPFPAHASAELTGAAAGRLPGRGDRQDMTQSSPGTGRRMSHCAEGQPVTCWMVNRVRTAAGLRPMRRRAWSCHPVRGV